MRSRTSVQSPAGYAATNLVGAALAARMTGTQLGARLWPQTAGELAAGITPTDYSYQPGNVRRYGALGDGSTDDSAAIQDAIRAITIWAGGETEDPDSYARGGEVFLPPGIYCVSDTIMLAPYVTLRGAAMNARAWSPAAYNAAGGGTADQLLSTIRALPGFPADQYVVDTAPWRYKTEAAVVVDPPYRVVEAADQFPRSLDCVDGTGAGARGTCVLDLEIDAANVAFGSLRMQCWYYGIIDRVSCTRGEYAGLAINSFFECTIGALMSQAPIPLLLQGGASIRQGGGEMLLQTVATASWIAGNQALITSVFYAATGGDSVGTWYDLTRKCLLAEWVGNMTFDSLSTYGCDVAVELYRAYLNLGHFENEFTDGAVFLLRSGSKCVVDGFSTKSAVPLATGDAGTQLVLREPFFLSSTTTFTPLNGESASGMEVVVRGAALPDGQLGQNPSLSTVNVTRLIDPQIDGIAFAGSITLYVDSTGSAAVAGTKASAPTTIDGALTFIAKNPHVREWQLICKDGQTHTIGTAHSLKNTRLIFARTSDGAAAVVSATVSPILRDCQLVLNSPTFSGWTSSELFRVAGTLTCNLGSYAGSAPTISIPAGKALFGAYDVECARVFASGSYCGLTFGAGAGLCSGGTDGFLNYEDALVHVTLTGTAALEAVTAGRVRCVTSELLAASGSTGWGAPSGGAVVANYPGATATLVQTSTALAELIAALKAAGVVGA